MKIDDLRFQLNELTRGGNWKDMARQAEDGGAFVVKIYSGRHIYRIRAHEARQNETSYLGCTFEMRQPLAGEEHLRGGDLADGPLDMGTWRKIVWDIAKNELVALGAP